VFKLYCSCVRSRLEIRSPFLEAIKPTLEELQALPIWANYPCVITDEAGNIVADNEIGK
jgi:hypothetical protein